MSAYTPNGTALRVPSLTLTDPAAVPALTQPYGLAGLSHLLEADSYGAAAGTTITTAWTDKVTGSASVQGAPLVGVPVLSDLTPGLTLPTVDMWTNADASVTETAVFASANTVLAICVPHGNNQVILTFMGRQVYRSSTGWVLRQSTGAAGNQLSIPFTAVPAPYPNTPVVVLASLSADGTADTFTVVSQGFKATASGPVAKQAATTLLVGKPGTPAGTGCDFAAVAVWPRQLTTTEVDGTVLPSLRRRLGINIPSTSVSLATTPATVSSVPAAFNLSGLMAYFDAGSISGTNNSVVASWADLSGNGNTATQATGSLQPKLVTTGVRPVVRFATSYLVLPNEASFELGNISVAALFKINPASTLSRGTLLSKGDTSWALGLPATGLTMRWITSWSSGTGTNYIQATADLTTSLHALVATATNTGPRALVVDGTAQGTPVDAPGPLATNTYPVWIGDNAQFPGRNMGMDLACLAIYNRALTTGERQAIEAALVT